MDNFEKFWTIFDDKRGRAGALKSWNKIKMTNDKLEQILYGARQYAKERSRLVSGGQTPKMAQGWLTDERWADYSMPKPVLKPVQQQVSRVSQYDAMNSKMGSYALANGQGANFWLAVDRINTKHERSECKDARDFINDKGGLATRYIHKQMDARDRLKGVRLADDDPFRHTLRERYKTALERERKFAEKYGG